MPKRDGIDKVLVIGSGPIVIGQAAEFDYAGTQACLALKEEGCRVVLVNNNPATIMTDDRVADIVYFEPMTVPSLENIIAKERPDSLLATLGGQTGLNLAYELHQEGILQKYGVRLLGTDIDSIMKGEDREAFRALMNELDEPVPESEIISTVEEAMQFAEATGYPLIIRPAYTLGGSGGGFAHSPEELQSLVAGGLEASPIHQCLLEKSIAGFKEIEFEVVRDENDTCVTVCSMENVDPVGVHTGDSIVVAPAQTLTESASDLLKAVSAKIIRALGIVGGCNIQFALNPDGDQYYLIEVNPRVSRSSALASKATGYPIAKIAAKLSLGYRLHELANPITGQSYAGYEPAPDYVAVKFPRWPFDKFPDADRTLFTQMKATGEVMAIERNLAGALQKAVRSLEVGTVGLEDPAMAEWPDEKLWDRVSTAHDDRFFAILELLRRGIPVERIQEKTAIADLFLGCFQRLIRLENKAKAVSLDDAGARLLAELKQNGFSDEWLAAVWDIDLEAVRTRRKQLGITPSYERVDARTAYYYSSWGGTNEGPAVSGRKKILVIGSGPIRIGQGIEFDYCSVHAVQALQVQGYETIIINNNPETVSTDYELADRLYFEPLALEDVMNVIEFEGVNGVVVQVGGQTAISLVAGLEKAGVPVLGVDQQTIDDLEDRDRFYQLLELTGIPHIPGLTAHNDEALFEMADRVGYPVLLRPSYVIGGRGMVILSSREDLKRYKDAALSHMSYPILIDAYMPGVEAEVDALTDGDDVLIPGILQHVEKAGVHSGDSTAVTPPFSLTSGEQRKLLDYTKRIARKMNFQGVFNIQFVIDEGDVYVLEINPRASRTVPMLSKIFGVDMIGIATRLMLGENLQALRMPTGLLPEPGYHTVKMPVFSTQKLPGVDPVLGPEMKSTGELIAIAETAEQAMNKAGGYTLRPGKEIFCEVDENCTGPIIELFNRLNPMGVTLVSDDADVAGRLGLTHVASFEEWVQSDGAAMLISIGNPGNQAGINKRLLAVKHRLAVVTELSQLVMFQAHDGEQQKLHSIQEWLRQSERSLVH